MCLLFAYDIYNYSHNGAHVVFSETFAFNILKDSNNHLEACNISLLSCNVNAVVAYQF